VDNKYSTFRRRPVLHLSLLLNHLSKTTGRLSFFKLYTLSLWHFFIFILFLFMSIRESLGVLGTVTLGNTRLKDAQEQTSDPGNIWTSSPPPFSVTPPSPPPHMSLRVTLNKAIKPSADMSRDDFKKAIFAGKSHSLQKYMVNIFTRNTKTNPEMEITTNKKSIG
jgi:hypothetical protein